MEKAYKGIMPGTYVALRNGDEVHSVTHVVLAKLEYESLINENKSLKSRVENEIRDRELAVANIRREMTGYRNSINADMERVKRDAEYLVEQEKQKADLLVNQARKDRDEQRELNANLLQIARERANAKRKLQPKREHCGYRYSGKIMQTKTFSGRDRIYADVWKATLETPYNGTIPLRQIRFWIMNDLKEEILAKLDILYWLAGESDDIWKGTYEKALEELKKTDGSLRDKNWLFDYNFMINPNSGLWEIQITTTDQIPLLPDLMGPRQKNAMDESVQLVMPDPERFLKGSEAYSDDSNYELE